MSVFAALNRLLKDPESTAGAITRGERAWSSAFLSGVFFCFAAYGVAAGFFQGGQQIAIAAVKAPLIVLATAALCLPSFYVFTSIAGSDLSLSRSIGVLTGFCALLALVMTGLIPVAWLFSVSTRSLAFVFWMHLVMWLAALLFARSYLKHAFPDIRQRRVLRLWMFLFILVSFQMTTHLRPVLWRDADQSFFTAEKMSFIEHFRAVTSKAPVAAKR